MQRVRFLVDGFNVYHSLRDAGKTLDNQVKWLDLDALCRGFLHDIRGRVELESVQYFTAEAKHLGAISPGTVARHRAYIECLEATGVQAIRGRFKKTQAYCWRCKKKHRRWEEKETDVAIATTLLSTLHEESADIIAIISGDTDLVPAVRAALRLFPTNPVVAIFPFKRRNGDLASLVDQSFNLTPKLYSQAQLRSPFVLASGRAVTKPASW